MRAFKCDKCGRWFDYSEDNGFITYSARSKGKSGPAMYEFDLCCNCHKDFLKFMNRKDGDSEYRFFGEKNKNGEYIARNIKDYKETITVLEDREDESV